MMKCLRCNAMCDEKNAFGFVECPFCKKKSALFQDLYYKYWSKMSFEDTVEVAKMIDSFLEKKYEK